MKEITTLQHFEAIATEECFVSAFGTFGSHYWSLFVKNEFVLPNSLLTCRYSVGRIENYMKESGQAIENSNV